MERTRARAVRFLVRRQSPDGSWTPLWFGNQEHPEKLNPLYGTSRVLRAAGVRVTGGAAADWRAALERGAAWLRSAQGADGGFGGAPGGRGGKTIFCGTCEGLVASGSPFGTGGGALGFRGGTGQK